jgi:mannose-6-phosphate isomerase-like protein (cupin superfamily)
MAPYATKTLPPAHDVIAPDGSEVRILLALKSGSMAHFRLPPGQVSQAIRHRTVEEIWYILSGSGEMWRSADGQDSITPLLPGTCLTIPLGVSFQFRCSDRLVSKYSSARQPQPTLIQLGKKPTCGIIPNIRSTPGGPS